MAERHAATPFKKPWHIHVGSLATNSSGLADSTMSNGTIGTVVTLSEFPNPPPLPTPTATAFSKSPTTSRYTDRISPTIPDYDSSSKFSFGTPPSPRSPVASTLSGHTKNLVMRSTQSTPIEPAFSEPRALDNYSPSSSPHDDSSRSFSARQASQNSSDSQQPVRTLNARDAPHRPPTSMRYYEKRPVSPQSNIAPSSIMDWSDGASGISGISVNPSEERLLSTSFITSLLSKSPEPFPGEKLSSARQNLVRQLDHAKSDDSSRIPRREPDTRSQTSHQSIPHPIAPFYPSDLLAPDVPQTAQLPPSLSGDHESVLNQESTTGHSDDGQLHLVTRKPSISYVLGGVEKRPVGVVPAYRVSLSPHGSEQTDSSYRISVNSGLTSSTLASKPPGHRADAPQNVTYTNAFEHDHEEIPRESEEEDISKVGQTVELIDDSERTELPMSPAIPSTAGSKKAFIGLDSRRSSNFTAGPGFASNHSLYKDSGRTTKSHSLQRSISKKSVVSSLISRISHGSAAARDRYMLWLKNRPLPPLPPMVSNRAPEIPNGREIQQSEESIPLPSLVRRADHLQGMLNRGRYPASSGYGSQFEYKEDSLVEEESRYAGHHSYAQIRASGTDDPHLSVFSRFRKDKEDSNYPEAASPTSPKVMTLEQKKKRRRLWIIIVCVVVGVILVIAIPVGISKNKKDSLPDCPGSRTGVACTLDATCVCTSDGDSCKPLASSLNLLVSDMNSLFGSNFTASQISDAVVSAVGSSSNTLCARQAMLIDVEPGLDSASSPNRTKWAQAAILWNLGMSEDIGDTNALQKFVSTADWDALTTSDGRTTDNNSNFAIDVSGYTFDFATQTVTPPLASFKASAPSDAQLAELTDDMISVLDRMYSFAIGEFLQKLQNNSRHLTLYKSFQCPAREGTPELLDGHTTATGRRHQHIPRRGQKLNVPPLLRCNIFPWWQDPDQHHV